MHVVYRFVLTTVLQIVAGDVEVIASRRLKNVFLHKLLVRHARSFLDDEREQRVADVAVALCRTWCVAEMTAQDNAQQRSVVGWGGEAVLLHDVACGEDGVAGIIGESCLMSEQLLHCDVIVALVLYGVDVERVREYALRSEHLVRQLYLAHVPQLHDAHGCDELRA